MAHWIIEDKGFGGVVYKCSNCRELWNDYYRKFPKDHCCYCGEIMDEDENEYIEESRTRKESDIIIFPQTIGDITFYSKEELFDWVKYKQKRNVVDEWDI